MRYHYDMSPEGRHRRKIDRLFKDIHNNNIQYIDFTGFFPYLVINIVVFFICIFVITSCLAR